jgi:hypothetical protein
MRRSKPVINEPAVDVDATAGELFEQQRSFVVKLVMADGTWEPHHDATTEDQAHAYVEEQRRRFPKIPADDWGVFAAETTRIELRIG